MAKKNKLAKVKNLECLNCGYPFFGNEIYCPECGQKNNNERINFGSFLKEVFNGFTSWDAKFWKTLFPLLTKPGKVSKDYIEGKRARYTNPFRFYLTTSVIFFLILGLNTTVREYKEMSEPSSDSLFERKTDSIKSQISIKGQDGLFNIGIKDDSELDSLKDPTGFNRMVNFNLKNPTMSRDEALDSLKIEKNFDNRFAYERAKGFASVVSGSGIKKIGKGMISKASIAMFILLPLFALFLRILYYRRKFTYVEHLVFVFHVQTILFLIFSIFYLINCFFTDSQFMSNYVFNFILLGFLVYLFIAMKRFYEQSIFKTFVKYILANLVFIILASLGTLLVIGITFISI